MKIDATQCSARAFVVCALLLASSASAQVLTITGGGRRIIDRDPGSAAANCMGWTYGAAPAVGPGGELLGMYVTSDALTKHCAAGIGIDSELRFGDSIRFHPRFEDGAWADGFNVVDRSRFDWMRDAAFLNDHPQSFAGHVASPSVVFREGRWYMAFVASLDDRNLCAGEHYAGNGCGSCLDPWSYFVIGWAVSDDGVNWRVRERAPGDPTLLGLPPDAIDKSAGSNFKGLTHVSLVADGDFFYLVAQSWSRNALQVVLFRVAFDASDEWGLVGPLQAWSANGWTADVNHPSPLRNFGVLGSVSRTSLVPHGRFIALNPDARGSSITYMTSDNLIDWSPPATMRSAIPFFADGHGYDVSVIDPIAVDGADGKLHVFFASADSDVDHGYGRDGHHDCGLYDDFGPTAVYLGTGIYEAIAEPRVLRATSTVLTNFAPGRFEVRVTSAAGMPDGDVVVSDAAGEFRVVPLIDGAAFVELPLTAPGDHTITAWFDAQGDWDASRAAPITHRVIVRRRAAR